MTLTRGLYYIYSGTSHVYRHHIEDRSLRQKRIFVLPNDVLSIQPVSILLSTKSDHLVFFFFQWNIEPTGDGRYLLKALGAPVAEDEGLLWAFLLNEKKDYEWVITLRSDDSFTCVPINLICASTTS